MTGLICCAVDGCRVTGRATFGRTIFFCTKHMGAGSDKALNRYAEAAARRKTAEAREAKGGRSALYARTHENTLWRRLVGEVAAKYPLKPGVEW